MASHELRSEVTGTVWKVEKAVGDRVEEGDVVMILESMKMEIPVEAEGAGVITAIHVAPQDSIDEEQLLADIGT
jgi:acetyl-CoA carboxylase biotin carboxyl carrier protein